MPKIMLMYTFNQRNLFPLFSWVIVLLSVGYLAVSLPWVADISRILNDLRHNIILQDTGLLIGSVKVWLQNFGNPYDQTTIGNFLTSQGFVDYLVSPPFFYPPTYYLTFAYFGIISYTQVFLLQYVMNGCIIGTLWWAGTRQVGTSLPLKILTLLLPIAFFFGYLNITNFLVATINVYLFFAVAILWILHEKPVNPWIRSIITGLILLILSVKYNFIFWVLPFAFFMPKKVAVAGVLLLVSIIGGFYLLDSQVFTQYSTAIASFDKDSYSMKGVSLANINLSIFGVYFRLQYFIQFISGTRIQFYFFVLGVSGLALLTFALAGALYHTKLKLTDMLIVSSISSILFFPVSWPDYLPMVMISFFLELVSNPKRNAEILASILLTVLAGLLMRTPLANFPEGPHLLDKILHLAYTSLPTVFFLSLLLHRLSRMRHYYKAPKPQAAWS